MKSSELDGRVCSSKLSDNSTIVTFEGRKVLILQV